MRNTILKISSALFICVTICCNLFAQKSDLIIAYDNLSKVTKTTDNVVTVIDDNAPLQTSAGISTEETKFKLKDFDAAQSNQKLL